MSGDPFEQAQRVADAVLWEGYVLYPYRASAAKNQVRWQYGVLTPKAFSEADGYEAWSMQTECLLEFGLEASVDVKLRYLQVQTRTVEELVDGAFKPVAELEVDGELWASWDEAVEHVLDIPRFDLARPSCREIPITLAAGRDVEALGAVGSRGAGALSGGRRRARRVRALPRSLPVHEAPRGHREPHRLVRAGRAARRSSCAGRSSPCTRCSTRDDARFISLLEPPEFAKAAVELCNNVGTFPVLIGDPDQPTTILSSPIILYDHPDGRGGEPRRHVRCHRDRRDPRTADPDAHRRREAPGPQHRSPGGRHRRPDRGLLTRGLRQPAR